MDNEILANYLVIAQTQDLYALAFKYALNESWELLAIVTIELSKRIKEDNTLTQYTTKHLKGIVENNE